MRYGGERSRPSINSITLHGMVEGNAGRSILICEDERIVALAEKSVLERAGYTVMIASSGEETLRMLDGDRQPDLILMDIDLGAGMDGTETASRIGERYDIPVVFLSAHTEQDIVERTEGITSYGYVVKHSGETVLLASIRMAFRLHETRRRQREAEDQLRRQNRYLELYRTAVEGMDDYKIALVDSTLTYRMVSRQFAAEYRVDESQIVGRTVADVVGEDDFEKKIRPFISRALAGESPEFCDWFDFPHRGSRYMRVKYYPLSGFDAGFDSGKAAVAVVIQDITEKTHTEQQARLAERNLDLILDSVPAVVWFTDREGRYIRVNRAWSETAGVAPSDAVGNTAFDVFAPEMAERLDEEERQIVRTGKPVIGHLQQYATLTGETGWTRTDRLPMTDESGDIIGVVGFAVDVTAEQEALEEVRKTEVRSQAILSALPDIVFVTDREGIILELHTGARELLVSADMEGERIGAGLPDDIAEYIHTAIRSAYETGELQVIEYSLQVPAGLRHFENRLVRMDDDRVLGIVRDITERKEAEQEAKRQVAEKENLLREVQHRIKNTMHTMGSMLSLHADSLSDTPEAAAALRDAWGRFQSMEVLYDQLYRTETHNQGSLRTYLNNVVETVVELFPIGSRVSAEVDVPDISLKTSVLSPLGMIVTELVTNAMKHAFADSPGGGPERPMLQVTGAASNGTLRVEVADNGPGVAIEENALPDESFGLRMVHALTEQLGGTIRFVHKGGTCATLEFKLPD